LTRIIRGEALIEKYPAPLSDHMLIVVIFLIACYYITTLYRNWDGGRSAEDSNLKRKNQEKSWISLGVGDMYRRIARQPPPTPYTREDPKWSARPLPIPTGNLAWHIQVKELFELRSRAFQFDADTG
jgi:hypothetical protein